MRISVNEFIPRICPVCDSADIEVVEAFDVGNLYEKHRCRRRKIYDATCLVCTVDFTSISGSVTIIHEGIEMGEI